MFNEVLDGFGINANSIIGLLDAKYTKTGGYLKLKLSEPIDVNNYAGIVTKME